MLHFAELSTGLSLALVIQNAKATGDLRQALKATIAAAN
jgi:hypothetical protein